MCAIHRNGLPHRPHPPPERGIGSNGRTYRGTLLSLRVSSLLEGSVVVIDFVLHLLWVLKKYFVVFIFRERGKEKERERNIGV